MHQMTRVVGKPTLRGHNYFKIMGGHTLSDPSHLPA